MQAAVKKAFWSNENYSENGMNIPAENRGGLDRRQLSIRSVQVFFPGKFMSGNMLIFLSCCSFLFFFFLVFLQSTATIS